MLLTMVLIAAVVLTAIAILLAERWVDSYFISDEEILADDKPLVRPMPTIVWGDGGLGPVIFNGERVSSGDARDSIVTPPCSGLAITSAMIGKEV